MAHHSLSRQQNFATSTRVTSGVRIIRLVLPSLFLHSWSACWLTNKLAGGIGSPKSGPTTTGVCRNPSCTWSLSPLLCTSINVRGSLFILPHALTSSLLLLCAVSYMAVLVTDCTDYHPFLQTMINQRKEMNATASPSFPSPMA